MTTQEPVSDFTTYTEVTNGFQHFVGGFVIDVPCILCENKTVYVQDLYDLIDFTNNSEFNIRMVRFWHAYLKGYKVTLILLDLKSGELLKRSHRFNNDTMPCDWVIVEYDFLHTKSKPEKAEKSDYHDIKE